MPDLMHHKASGIERNFSLEQKLKKIKKNFLKRKAMPNSLIPNNQASGIETHGGCFNQEKLARVYRADRGGV
jgi:hypothetical protein